MSRAVEPFTPIDAGRVSLYTCGPTVYNYAHIGNFRTFLFEDVLRRWLEASGYEVFHIQNLTDVDDKTIKGAVAKGEPLSEYVVPFIDAFHEDRHYLNMLDAHEYPRATDFIEPMIALVQSLLDRNVAYRGDDGSVYFAIARYPQYGRLSRLDTRELKEGASGRTSADEYAKEDARDFVLWKSARDDDETVGAAWDAPFGRGRPGWHLECSAMALDLLAKRYGRDVLDIHAGGVDLIFPHHEDEIAQSCAHTGQHDFARVWMHGEFLLMSGTKMSKRFGNILTARDLRLDHVDPATVRLMFATTHYRQTLDFTDDAMASAREGSRRLGEFATRVSKTARGESTTFDQIALVLGDEFAAAMDDDLNTSRALAALFEAARAGNRALDAGEKVSDGFAAAWKRGTGVLQVIPAESQMGVSTVGQGEKGWEEAAPPDLDSQFLWASWWAGKRLGAKQARDFAASDRIRELLAAHGWEVRDNRDGTATVQRK